MNNYLYANLVTGKISRSQTGGGRPIFTIGESNKTQIYFLDYPNPNYPSQALNDGFAFYPQPIEQNQTLTLKIGRAIGEDIILDNTWSNLPTTVSIQSTFIPTTAPDTKTDSEPWSGDILFSIKPIPISGFVRFNFQLNFANDPPSTPKSSSFLFNPLNSISLFKNQLDDAIFQLGGVSSISQTNDFNYLYSFRTGIQSQYYFDTNQLTISTTNNTLSGAPGKYGELDFTSPLWESVIGNNNEVEIWIDAMLGSSTVAQGPAILRKRLTS